MRAEAVLLAILTPPTTNLRLSYGMSIVGTTYFGPGSVPVVQQYLVVEMILPDPGSPGGVFLETLSGSSYNIHLGD